MKGKELPQRDAVKKENKWRVEDLFGSDSDWESALDEVLKKIDEYGAFRGTLCDKPGGTLEFFKFNDETELLLERVYCYASMRLHEDMANAKYQGFFGRAQNAYLKLCDEASFVDPELLALSDEQMSAFMAYPGMEPYKKYLNDLSLRRPHTLSKKEEALLSSAGKMAQSPSEIFSMFNNADIDFPFVRDENGDDVKLSHGTYTKLLESRDRRVRKDAFKAMYETYGRSKNTIAAVFNANLKQASFFAKARNYPSARGMYMSENHIPEKVYDNLIDVVHENIGLMHRYVKLRKRALGLDELHMYDLYVPMTGDFERTYTFSEAKEIACDALRPLGDDYVKLLRNGMNGGWIDVYENRGKRSGAYSTSVYGTHPFVLMNFNGTLNDVFTLVHEMGHSLHSHYSNENQPYSLSGYRIFVAEVASTCNESLLINYLLKKCRDDTERIFLLNRFLENFKGTLYRQTMFAEFEKKTHEMIAEGNVLTADSLCEIYYGLNRFYFGDGMSVDRDIEFEWARIPHFYTPFYVYQYATGMSASIAISKRILNEGDPAVRDYKKFLKSGGSADPIDLLRIAGVDMESPEPVREAMGMFGDLLDEMEGLL